MELEAGQKEDYILAETAARVSGWVRGMDTTRPTTANLVVPHVSMVSGYADTVYIVGYSYRNMEIPWAKEHFPEKQVAIHECPGSLDDWNYFKSVFSDEPHLSIGTKPLERSGFKMEELSGHAVARSNGSYRWRGSLGSTIMRC